MSDSPAFVFALLGGICALFFILEEKTKSRVFKYFPPLLWIYAVPVVLRNLGVFPDTPETGPDPYEALGSVVLPGFLVLMLIGVDVRSAFKVVGRGLVVMFAGSFGIMLGAVAACAVFSRWLAPDAWKQFGALSGAWIGGTANMAAVAGGMGLAPSDLSLAILADNVVYVVWLPILLSSRDIAERFNRWAKVDPKRTEALAAAQKPSEVTRSIRVADFLYLGAIAAIVIWAANQLAPMLPELPPVLSTGTWRTLILTTASLGLSFTPIRKIPSSRELGLALVYIYLAGMGARASFSGLENAPLFLVATFFWILLHGLTLVLAAKIFRVDIHTAAIASAANIGGAASAPVVAAHHRESLVPASILMAVVGYAAGNYLAVLTSQLCYWVSAAP